MKYEIHDFYCIKCGHKGIPLPRKISSQRGKLHRKRLYCLYCKKDVNHIECRNQKEIEQFKEDFESGVYLNEPEVEGVSNVRAIWGWEEYVGA